MGALEGIMVLWNVFKFLGSIIEVGKIAAQSNYPINQRPSTLYSSGQIAFGQDDIFELSR